MTSTAPCGSRWVGFIGCLSLLTVAAALPAGAQETPHSSVPPAAAQSQPSGGQQASRSRSGGSISDRLYFGGGFGLSFGTVDYVEIAPLVGYRISPDVSLGGSLIYRYRNDDRYQHGVSTSDYGGSLFGEYQVAPPFFLHAEVEYLSYEQRGFDASTMRDDYTSVFLGGGMSWPAGDRTSLFALVLYNVAYTADRYGPYSGPWVARFGVSFGL